jgi:hypothetical protein
MKLKRKSDIEHLSDIEQEDNLVHNGTFSPIAMPMVRRAYPKLFADVLVSVVPQDPKKYNSPKLNPKKQKFIHKHK